MIRYLSVAALLAVVIALGSFGPPHAAPPRPDSGGVRLVVLVYFDQFRGDYLARWRDQFGEGGFRRLCDDGAWYTDCHYPYAYTVTACGHTSVAAGCPPVDHGVVGASFLFWGFTGLFTGIYAFLFVAHAVLLVALFTQWFRELS